MRSWAQCSGWFEHVSEFRGVGVIVLRSWCCVCACFFFLLSFLQSKLWHQGKTPSRSCGAGDKEPHDGHRRQFGIARKARW